MRTQKIDFEDGEIIYSPEKITLNFLSYQKSKKKIRSQLIIIGLIILLSGLVFKYFPIVLSIPVGFMVTPLLFALILSNRKVKTSKIVFIKTNKINFIKQIDEQILLSYKNKEGVIESKLLHGLNKDDLEKLKIFCNLYKITTSS